jgi:hypothetical protein
VRHHRIHRTVKVDLLVGTPVYRLQVKARGRACCHMSSSSGPCLPVDEDFGAAMCLVASDPAFPLEGGGGLRCCHVSRGSEPCLPIKKGSSAATCPVKLCGLRKSRIKKGVASLAVQLGSHVSKVRSHLPKVHVPDKCCSSR